MKSRFNRGSLLFETFIALMFLAIGITSTLRIFGDALSAARKYEETTSVRRGMGQFLFPWFAYAEGIGFEDEGIFEYPLEIDGKESSYTVEVIANNLMSDPDETEEQKLKRKQRVDQYYHIRCKALKDQDRIIANLSAVVLKMKKPEQGAPMGPYGRPAQSDLMFPGGSMPYGSVPNE